MTGRSVPLWEGKTPDAPIPARVRLRVFEAFQGRCYLTGRKIRPGEQWQIDHIVALCNGGRHAEDNFAPVLTEAHKAKTQKDVAQKAKDARVRKKHLGLHKPRNPLPGGRNSRFRKKVDGSVETRD